MLQVRGRRKRALTLVLATTTIAGFLPSITAHGAARTWLTSAGGSYDTATNWTGGVVPTGSDSAFFNLAGSYTVSFTTPRSITSASVSSSDATWNLGGTTYPTSTLSSQALTIGPNASDQSQLTVSTGTISGFGGTIGGVATSRGTLSITSGATASFSGTLNVGSVGFGTLNITNGGQVITKQCNLGASAGGAGTVVLNAAGSSFTVFGFASCTIGNAGTGLVALSANTSANTTGVTLGNLSGSSGVISINSASWTNTSPFYVGNFGAGSLNVNNGTLSADLLAFGNEAASLGVATFANGSVVDSTNGFNVASLGTATVTLDSASTLSAGPVTVASGAGSRGELNINATATSLNSSGALTVGGANGSNGTINITNGGSLTATTAQIAPASGSAGAVNLSGAGSRWTCSGSLQLGGNGTTNGSGSISVGSGASLTVTNSNALYLYSTGVLNISGGTVSIGSINNAGGVLNFNSGTLLFTGSSLTIDSSSALGQTVDLAAGKSITASGSATIAPGAMLELTGGNFRANALTNNGEILLASPTATLNAPISNSGLIRGDGRIVGTLANSSAGELRVSNGERIAFSNDNVGNSNAGSINLFGGIVEFDHLLTNTGRITGRGTVIAHGAISNLGTIALSAGASDVIGALTNLASGKTIVTGGSTSTFFDNVTNIAGSEFRVSTASTAVFLGNVTGLSAFTGPGTKDFEGSASGLMISTNTGTTIVGADGNLTASFIRDGSLQVEGVATIITSGSSANVSRIGTLSIDGGSVPIGTLDLNDNDLITTSSSKSVIESQIKFARHNGLRDRPGITSTVARNHPTHSTTLGVLSGAEYRSIYGLSSSFDNFTVADSDVLVKYTYYGDTDFNGIVDFDDYSRADGLSSTLGS